MKKCGVFVLILMTSIMLAFIPGMDKRHYGGEIWFSQDEVLQQQE